MQALYSALVFVVVVAQPLVDSDVLEPSVRNEVDHALARAPVADEDASRAKRDACLPFATNGMTRTDLAIRLVSTQNAAGRWLAGTNDYTTAALAVLKGL